MANKNKYSVTSEYGTFTRSTNRKYSHMVATCGRSEDVIRARFAAELKNDLRMVVRYTEGAKVAAATGFAGTYAQDDDRWVSVAHKGFEGNQARICGHTLADITEWAAHSQQQVETSAARLEKALADNAATIANKQGSDVGWASRLDLAVSNANKYRKLGYTAYVVEIATGNVVA
jgi:hypothetical protein